MLLEAARQNLPADPLQWSKTCKEQALIGESLIELRDHYLGLESNPGWQHYQGMLWSLKLRLENAILQGAYENDQDITPHMRSAYGIVLQVLAIPEQIKNQTLMAEYEASLTDDLHITP